MARLKRENYPDWGQERQRDISYSLSFLLCPGHCTHALFQSQIPRSWDGTSRPAGNRDLLLIVKISHVLYMLYWAYKIYWDLTYIIAWHTDLEKQEQLSSAFYNGQNWGLLRLNDMPDWDGFKQEFANAKFQEC